MLICFANVVLIHLILRSVGLLSQLASCVVAKLICDLCVCLLMSFENDVFADVICECSAC